MVLQHKIRAGVALLLVLIFSATWVFSWRLYAVDLSYLFSFTRLALGGSERSYSNFDSALGVASQIYVVSLPHRTDRRAVMERLRYALSLDWTYIDAVPSNDSRVEHILDHVRVFRENATQSIVLAAEEDAPSPEEIAFVWPDSDYFDLLVHSSSPLPMSDAVGWTLPLARHSLPPATASMLLTCASLNFVSGSPYSVSLPPYKLLTPSRVACWHSHMEVVWRIANGKPPQDVLRGRPQGSKFSKAIPLQEVSIILEDDVDMEVGIRARLQSVWTSLPTDWDVVFLGHCWSNESLHAPISETTPHFDRLASGRTALHPAFAPKCSHAYALSRTGARRLLLHLLHPPFAYSRAYDQALSWLVSSGRLKAFSIVPSVVVQLKMGESDIDPGGDGAGSTWRERLEHGVVGG